MNYLKKREDFLESIKRSKEASNLYHRQNKTELIKEQAFENDINWGDSLVGRLINSTIRKAKIGANLVRIDRLIGRLKDTMDEIILTSSKNSLSREDKMIYSRVLAASYFRNIQIAINEYEKGEGSLEEIKNLVKAAIKYVEEDPQAKELPDKNKILQQLNEFLKFIEPLKDEKEEAQKEEVEKTGKKEESNKIKEVYYKNFLSASRLLNLFVMISQSIKAEFANKQKANQANTQTPVKEIGVENKEPDNKVPETTGTKKTDAPLERKLYSYNDFVNEAEAKVVQLNPQQSTTPTSKSPILGELKKLYTSVNKQGNEETLKILQGILKGETIKTSGGAMNTVKRIYEEIRKKSGLPTADLNESLENFLTDGVNGFVVGLPSLYKVAKTNPKLNESDIKDKNLLARINEELPKFVKSMDECLNKDLYQFFLGKEEKGAEEIKNTEEKIEKTSESRNYQLKRYYKIFEAEEEKKKSVRERVCDYWNNKIDLKKYVVSEDEVEKIKTEVDKQVAEKKDSIIIDGMDPIIEIVKIFNRAYKLYTVPVIPTGRSGGKVSNKTFLEYEPLGGSNASPDSAGQSGGPYRNNKLFDKWESAVLDVFKVKEYQPIFNVGTEIKVGNEMVKKAGANLRKFMNSLLDGDKLYKGGDRGEGGGAQAEFLDKYFGYSTKDGEQLSYKTADGPDVDGNLKVAESVLNPKLTLQKTDNPKLEVKNAKGLSFAVSYTSDGTVETIYCVVEEVVGDYYYIIFSDSAYYLKRMVEKETTRNTEIGSGDSTIKEVKQKQTAKQGNDQEFGIYATKVKAVFDEKGVVKFPENFTIKFVENGEKDMSRDNKLNKPRLVEKKTYFNPNFTNCKLKAVFNIVDTSKKEKEDWKRITVKPETINWLKSSLGGIKDIKSTVNSFNAEIK